jgi:hypothetical protein
MTTYRGTKIARFNRAVGRKRTQMRAALDRMLFR